MKIRFPTGTTQENNQLLLPEGFLSIDLERKAVRLHDGTTQGGFEIVGQQAHILGAKWTPLNSSLNLPGLTTCLSFGGDKWIIGYGPNIYTSDNNGLTWSYRNPNLNNRNVKNVIYGNGMWLASGYATEISTSTDGINWINRKSALGVATQSNVQSSHYGNNRWWLGLWQPPGGVYTSVDGLTWNRMTTLDVISPNHVTPSIGTNSTGGVLVGGVAGNAFFSPNDGLTWHSVDIKCNASSHVTNIAYAANIGWLLITSNGEYRTSPDGINWTIRPGFAGKVAFSSLVTASNRWYLSNISGSGDYGIYVGLVNGEGIIEWSPHPDFTNPVGVIAFNRSIGMMHGMDVDGTPKLYIS